jgi:hypothetical protein
VSELERLRAACAKTALTYPYEGRFCHEALTGESRTDIVGMTRDAWWDHDYELLSDLQHWTRRMLQALDAYWLHYEGYHGNGMPRSQSGEEEWWHRFEKYRKRVEALLSAETAPGRIRRVISRTDTPSENT